MTDYESAQGYPRQSRLTTQRQIDAWYGAAFGPIRPEEWDQIQAADAALRKDRKQARAKQVRRGGAITYRFLKDGYGWRLMVTLTASAPALIPDYRRGAVGIDLNDGFLAVSAVDAAGNLLWYRRLALTMVGKTAGQRLALIHDLAQELILVAMAFGLPLVSAQHDRKGGRSCDCRFAVIETLDFSAKKARLKEIGCERAARRLSSFAYATFAAVLQAHGRRHGVAVVSVDPAYTSVIGAALIAVPQGLTAQQQPQGRLLLCSRLRLTIHGAAAVAIARRAMKVAETLPKVLRLWRQRQKPLAIARPSDLQSKATVNPYWPGWKSLSEAVHVARESDLLQRESGTKRRRRHRDQRSLAADAAFLLTM